MTTAFLLSGGGSRGAVQVLGAAIPYDRVPYFFSDQYDLGME